MKPIYLVFFVALLGLAGCDPETIREAKKNEVRLAELKARKAQIAQEARQSHEYRMRVLNLDAEMKSLERQIEADAAMRSAVHFHDQKMRDKWYAVLEPLTKFLSVVIALATAAILSIRWFLIQGMRIEQIRIDAKTLMDTRVALLERLPEMSESERALIFQGMTPAGGMPPPEDIPED